MENQKNLNSSFIKTVLKIGIPISIQNLAQASVGFIDTAMVAQLGEITLGAIGLSQQIGFFLIVATLGLASGGGVLITRYWGANNIEAVRSITSITVAFSLFTALIIGVVSFFYSSEILYLLSSRNFYISSAGTSYLKITALSFPFTALTISLSIQLRCVNKSQYPMYMTLVSLPTAILFNYILIYGKLGFPALGATGAAIGTLLTRLIEFFLTLFFFSSTRNPIWSGSWQAFTSIFKAETKKYATNTFLQLALPITIMELLWVLGQSFYKISYAHLGISELAAYTAFENIVNLFNAGFIGLGNTAAIVIGQEIGKNNMLNTKVYSLNFIKLNFLFFIPMGFILIYLTPLLTKIFSTEKTIANYLYIALIMTGSTLSLKSFNFLLMTGILRTGGDARFIAVSTAIAMTAAVILTYWFTFVHTKNFYWILTITIVEENLRNIFSLIRYKSNLWLKKQTNNPVVTIT